jgi:hypothetical protein
MLVHYIGICQLVAHVHAVDFDSSQLGGFAMFTVDVSFYCD